MVHRERRGRRGRGGGRGRPGGAGDGPAPGRGAAAPVDALHAPRRLPGRRDPPVHQRHRRPSLRRARPLVARRPGRLVRRAGRPRPGRPGRGRPAPGAAVGVLPDLVGRPPGGDRARHPARRPGAGRPEPRVLHDRRFRGRRVRLEAGARLLQGDRPTAAHQGGGAPSRLPRHHARRPGHHRCGVAAHPVPAARARGGPRRQHQPIPLRIRPRRDRGRRALQCGVRRGHRTGHPGRRARDRGRRVPRAPAEHRRMLHAAPGVLRPRAATSATATASCSSPTR